MSHEIKNITAIELSEAELDNVAGGQSLDLGTLSTFEHKNVSLGQQTLAGPNGAGTSTLVSIDKTISAAGQYLSIFN